MGKKLKPSKSAADLILSLSPQVDGKLCAQGVAFKKFVAIKAG